MEFYVISTGNGITFSTDINSDESWQTDSVVTLNSSHHGINTLDIH